MQVVVLLLLTAGIEVWALRFHKSGQLKLPFPKTYTQRIDELSQTQVEMKEQLEVVLKKVEDLQNGGQTQTTEVRSEHSIQGDTVSKETRNLLTDLSTKYDNIGKREDAMKASLRDLTSKHDTLREDHDRLAQKVNDLLFCGPPPNVTNATVTYEDDAVGSEATYVCQPDFRQCGDDMKITCLSNRSWEKPSVQCDQFRWIDPDVPFLEALPCGAQSKLKVIITGTPTTETALGFNLMKMDDILFHASVRFNALSVKKGVVFDSFINGKWIESRVHTTFPFMVQKTFTLDITLEDGVYRVNGNGAYIGSYTELLKNGKPEKLEIRQGLTLQKVEILF